MGFIIIIFSPLLRLGAESLLRPKSLTDLDLYLENTPMESIMAS